MSGKPGMQYPSSAGETREDSAALAEAIEGVAKSLRLEMPAPKGSPFYGLDHGLPYAVELLHLLGSQGIFRKYEFVLEVFSGLGGRARWATRQFGCRVLGLEPDLHAAQIATRLGESSGTLGEAVFCGGAPETLPFRSGAFTHAWWLDPRRGMRVEDSLSEISRVVRDGGYFAWVLQEDKDSPEWAREQLRATGFVVTEERRTRVVAPDMTRRVAEQRLERLLQARAPLLKMWKEQTGWDSRMPESLMLLFARREAKRVAG